MLKLANKGIVLFVVLMTVIMLIILGNIVLGIMLSENRFSHHKVSRIQAYYASRAGLTYASEMLRQYYLNPSSAYKNWVPQDTDPGTGTGMGTGATTVCALLCRTSGCTSASCPVTSTTAPVATIVDPNLPAQINSVTIIIGESLSGVRNTPKINSRSIRATVNYTASQ